MLQTTETQKGQSNVGAWTRGATFQNLFGGASLKSQELLEFARDARGDTCILHWRDRSLVNRKKDIRFD